MAESVAPRPTRIEHIGFAISAMGVAGHELLDAIVYPRRRRRLLVHIDLWLGIAREQLDEAGSPVIGLA